MMAGELIDITGQRFGSLVVLERAGSRNNREATWRCRCDCGKSRVAASSKLRSGEVRHCGCQAYKGKRRPGFRKRMDLSGQRFGRLTAIEWAGKTPRGQSFWRCVCDCGGEKIAMSYSLRTGRVQSCGCLRAEYAARLASEKAARNAAAQKRRAAPRTMPAPEPKAAATPPRHQRAFSADEHAAIEAAIAEGKVARIPNGQWPDASRPEIYKMGLALARKRGGHKTAVARRSA